MRGCEIRKSALAKEVRNVEKKTGSIMQKEKREALFVDKTNSIYKYYFEVK